MGIPPCIETEFELLLKCYLYLGERFRDDRAPEDIVGQRVPFR